MRLTDRRVPTCDGRVKLTVMSSNPNTLAVASCSATARFVCVVALGLARLAVLSMPGLVLAPSASAGEPLRPASDAEVVEVLPSGGPARAEERRLRQRWAAAPGDATVAVALAKRYLDQAREQGEPRFAGRALATLQHWQDPATAPAEVTVMLATLQQYLHDFDGAASLLEGLVRREPRQAQAWLTLATIRRVQGRYDASDAACQGVATAGSAFYARACAAENASLRGRVDEARRSLLALKATPQLAPSAAAWLTTTLAEVEWRAGRLDAAEAAFREVMRTGPDEYARIAYADFLIERGRAGEVPPLLKSQARSDATLLRLAIAGTLRPGRTAREDIAELRARMDQAALRPDAGNTHAREQAMYALLVAGEPARALPLAVANVGLQREPIDLLLLARTAAAARDAAALAQARRLRDEVGLRDARLDALL